MDKQPSNPNQPGQPASHGSQPVQQAPAFNGAPLVANQIPPQMMNLVADPALAAAAASSLFPNPALLSNPSAFLAMPQMLAAQGMQAATTSTNTNTAASAGTPKPVLSSQTMPTGFNPAPLQPNAASSTKPTWNQPLLATSTGFQGAMMPMPTGNAADASLPAATGTTAMQVQMAAAAAAAAAVPKPPPTGGAPEQRKGGSGASKGKKADLTPEERAKLNRDRNREHARSTRLRKKAYVQKLKELVEGLHAERTEEVRKRRVAIQHLAEKQNVRRAVVRSFLRFHSSCESDPRKWMTILEDNFWLKQPVTPYRSFRRVEIERECRISRGVDAVVADAASLSVMVEGIGSRSARWMQIKRDEATNRGGSSPDAEGLPHSIIQQNNRYQHTMSSLSSSSSGSSAGEECRRHLKRPLRETLHPSKTAFRQPASATGEGKSAGAKKVSSSGSSNDSGEQEKPSNDFHVYNAPSLPDPKLDSEGSSPADDSQGESNSSSGGEAGGTKQVSTDSSSGEEDKLSDTAVKASYPKRRKVAIGGASSGAVPGGGTSGVAMPSGVARITSSLPNNIAKSGGISHNIRPVATHATPLGNGSARLGLAPPTPLPPFAGLGKRAPLAAPTTVGAVEVKVSAGSVARQAISTASQAKSLGTAQSSLGPTAVSVDKLSNSSRPVAEVNGEGAGKSRMAPVLISADVDASSSNSSSQAGQIRAYYHINEDDMLLTEDVLMCPFIFRSQDAVMYGALAECIMPGMLRAHFSPRNKLLSLEMVYDAMGFMQQLERASGSEGSAQIVPGSLEMALSPNANEARVITMAKSPFLIVSVNEAWTKMTKYTQMEVEGRDLNMLNGSRTDPEASVRPGKPPHRFGDVAQGRCACSTNMHYDKDGREFVDYMCSYPLTNTDDEVTHLLHVCKELPMPSPPHEFSELSGGGEFPEPMNTQ